MIFFILFYDVLFLRGLITCGLCPCCPSRTSPITSVSLCLWVNLASKILFLSLVWINSLIFVSPFVDRVKWAVPLKEKPLPTPTTTFSFKAAVFEKEDDVSQGRYDAPPFPFVVPCVRCCDGIRLSHYCTLFFKDIQTEQAIYHCPYCNPLHMSMHWAISFCCDHWISFFCHWKCFRSL